MEIQGDQEGFGFQPLDAGSSEAANTAESIGEVTPTIEPRPAIPQEIAASPPEIESAHLPSKFTERLLQTSVLKQQLDQRLDSHLAADNVTDVSTAQVCFEPGGELKPEQQPSAPVSFGSIDPGVQAAFVDPGVQAAAPGEKLNEDGSITWGGREESLQGTGGVALLEFAKDSIQTAVSNISSQGAEDVTLRKTTRHKLESDD